MPDAAGAKDDVAAAMQLPRLGFHYLVASEFLADKGKGNA